MFRKIYEAYRRWRHTRGFGVHSPFGYEIVRNVLRPGREYGWYAYSDIDEALYGADKGKQRRQARLLLRLASFLDAKSAFVPMTTSPAYLAALKGARTDMRICKTIAEADSCDIVCSYGDFMTLDSLKEIVAGKNSALLLHDCPEGWDHELFETLDEGVMLHSMRNLVLIPHDGMQKVAYTVRL